MEDLDDNMKEYIQQGDETKNWEFKPPQKWQVLQYELTRSIFAMSNIDGGGNIIIGISERDDRRPGKNHIRRGFTSDNDFKSYNNEDDISRFLNSKCNRKVRFKIFGGPVNFLGKKKLFVVIRVFESKNSVPIICQKNHEISSESNKKKTKVLNCGTVYIRSGNPVASKPIETEEDWQEIIIRLRKLKQENLLDDLNIVCRRFGGLKRKKAMKFLATDENKYNESLKKDGRL